MTGTQGTGTQRTATRGSRRRGRGRALATSLAVLTVPAMLVVAPGTAHARCVTVGLDSISHTSCGLP